MKKVNIPRSVTDDHYRYKTEAIQAKNQGSGIGQHTKVVNVVTVAKDLNRESRDIMKFFSIQLASQIRDGDIINGKHIQADIAKALDIYIDKYVLCGKCNNPETNFFVSGGILKLQCISCGSETVCDVKHKFTEFQAKQSQNAKKQTQAKKNEVANSIKTNNKTTKKVTKKKVTIKKDNVSDEGVEWSLPQDAKFVKERRKEALKRSDQMVVDYQALLIEILKTNNLNELKTVRDGMKISPEELTIKICHVKLCNIKKDIKDFCIRFKDYMTNPRHQKGLIQYLAQNHKDNLLGALKYFLDHDILEEEIIEEWYDEAETEMFEVKLKMAPFITWLHEADIESDSN